MILVTGSTGLLGSHLIANLLLQGEQVRCLYRNEQRLDSLKKVLRYYSDDTDQLFHQIDFRKGDILDISLLDECMSGITKVYHCAALVSFHPRDKRRVYQINVEGTANVVNASLDHEVQSFCYVSSTAALGKNHNVDTLDESHTWIESAHYSHYGKSKYLAECEVWRGLEEGLNAVIVNPSVIIGPGNWGESSTETITKVWKGLKFYPYGANAFVDVRDVVEIMIQLTNNQIKGERFLVTGSNLSFKDYFSLIAQNLNKQSPNIPVSNWMAELTWRIEMTLHRLFGKSPLVTRETARSATQTIRYNSNKVREMLDFQFRPIEDSLRFTCNNFLLENKAK